MAETAEKPTWSREAIESIVLPDKTVKFLVKVDLWQLVDADGMDGVNNMLVDDQVEDGHQLMDLKYELAESEGDTLTIRVTADVSEYINHEN